MRLSIAGSVVLAVTGFCVTGLAQQYHYTTAVSGGMGLSIQDDAVTQGIGLTFGQMSVDVWLDGAAGTIRQAGTVEVTPVVGSIDLSQTKLVPQAFPNPPAPVDGTLTVSYGLTGGMLSFDTGPRAVTWDPVSQLYSFDGGLGNIPISGSYQLTTGGKTYDGTFSYEVYPRLGGYYVFSSVDTENYPSSITLSNMGTHGGMFFMGSGAVLSEFTADNGYPVRMIAGVGMYGIGPGDGFSWSSQPATAYAVTPEPLHYATASVLSLLGFAAWRRHAKSAKN